MRSTVRVTERTRENREERVSTLSELMEEVRIVEDGNEIVVNEDANKETVESIDYTVDTQ